MAYSPGHSGPQSNTVTIRMKEFRENIGDDEQMLEFAANHLDTPDEAKVKITIPKVEREFSKVTFEVLPFTCSCGFASPTLRGLVEHTSEKMMPLRRLEQEYGKDKIDAI